MIITTDRISTFPHLDGQQIYMGFLAPDSEDLLRMHYGQIDKEEFRRRYYKHLTDSIETHPKEWMELIEQESITLLCDCGSMQVMADQEEADKTCHRFMCQDFLEQLLISMGKAVLAIKEADQVWEPPLPIYQELFGEKTSKAPRSIREESIALKVLNQSPEWR